MKLNKKPIPLKTHEGGAAQRITVEQELRRSIMACLLWENQFYENGEDISARIQSLIPKVAPEKVFLMAIEAREKMKLRHVPLLLAREMARLPKHKAFVKDTLKEIIQRPDELSEFLAIYWKDGRQPLSSQVKRGLAAAFKKFNEYQLAKYNRDGQIKLRDVLFLSHAKPQDKAQEKLWKRLINNNLKTPDTWEVELSAGKDKKKVFTRLLKEKKLGALALLRNLRNMEQAKVEQAVIKGALLNMETERVLPFRFISAAKYAPGLEDEIEWAMVRCLKEQEILKGKTRLLVDVSGSMDDTLSSKSEMTRMDAACGLAVLLREIAEDVSIYSFSEECVQIPARRGFALRDAILNSQPHSGTYLNAALRHTDLKFDRTIVITDEQSYDDVKSPNGLGYCINVASYKNGVGYGGWIHIDGWSEAIINYIQKYEEC